MSITSVRRCPARPESRYWPPSRSMVSSVWCCGNPEHARSTASRYARSPTSVGQRSCPAVRAFDQSGAGDGCWPETPIPIDRDRSPQDGARRFRRKQLSVVRGDRTFRSRRRFTAAKQHVMSPEGLVFSKRSWTPCPGKNSRSSARPPRRRSYCGPVGQEGTDSEEITEKAGAPGTSPTSTRPGCRSHGMGWEVLADPELKALAQEIVNTR